MTSTSEFGLKVRPHVARDILVVAFTAFIVVGFFLATIQRPPPSVETAAVVTLG